MKATTIIVAIVVATLAGCDTGHDIQSEWPGECAPQGATPQVGDYDLGEPVCEAGCGDTATTEALSAIDEVAIRFTQIDLYHSDTLSPLGFLIETESCLVTDEESVIILDGGLSADRVWACNTSCGPMVGIENGSGFSSAEIIRVGNWSD